MLSAVPGEEMGRKPKPKGFETKKTSLSMSVETWRSAKIRAIQEGTDLQGIVEKAIRFYLASTEPPKGKKSS